MGDDCGEGNGGGRDCEGRDCEGGAGGDCCASGYTASGGGPDFDSADGEWSGKRKNGKADRHGATLGSAAFEHHSALEYLAAEEYERGKKESEASREELENQKGEWLDLLGSGDLKKRVIKPGVGEISRPQKGDWLVANIICRNSSGHIVDNLENFELRLGHTDIVPGLDLAIALMQNGEQAEIQVPSRLAFGNRGRQPDIPPDDDLCYDVTLLSVSKKSNEDLTVLERLKLGNEKRKHGNFWYSSEDCVNAINCYQKACEYLDGIHDGSENPPEILQAVLDSRIAVNNNLAAAYMKMNAYDVALKSLDFVIKMQPKNVKAHFRKGKALAAKEMVSEAVNEMKIAVKLEPDSKVIQEQLNKLLQKQRIEEDKLKAMYKRMMGMSNSKTISPQQSSWRKWSVMAGSVLVVAVALAAFRQYHSG